MLKIHKRVGTTKIIKQMKKILLLSVAWLGILTCAAQGEWQEIFFTQATAAGHFNDSVFTAENSAFSFTCSDAANKLVVDANTSRFGTAEAYQTYDFRMKTSNASPSFTFNIPADGVLRFAARSANKNDATRVVNMEQNGVNIFSETIKESDQVEVVEGEATVPVFEYHSVFVSAGSVTLSVTNGINFYSFSFKEEADPDAGTHCFIAGSMTEWQNGMVEMDRHGSSFSTTLVLDANTLYQYKVVKVEGNDTTWYGVNVAEGASWEPMNADNCSGWWLNGNMNVGLQTSKKGEYTFLFENNDNKEVSVVYPSEWDEIVFTDAIDAGTNAFMDSVFTIIYSDFSMTTIDDPQRMKTAANNSAFGEGADVMNYSHYLQFSGNTCYAMLSVPADGILRIAARTANKDSDRTFVVLQDGDTLLNKVVSESDRSAIGSYPFSYVNVHAGAVKISAPVSVNFYGIAFKEAIIEEPHFYIAGSMTNWQNGMVEMERHGMNYSSTLMLEANTLYQYKVVKVLGADTTWFGVNVAEGASWEPMTADNCTGWWLSDGQNIGLQTTRKGDYTFRFVENENNEISVIYPSEWDEIYFTALTEAGIYAFVDSVFTVKYSDFYMTVNDVKNQALIKETSKPYKFGDATSYTSYTYYINSSSKFTKLECNIPADGVLRIAAHKTDVRNYRVAQNGDTIATFEVNNTAISEDGYWPYAYVNVSEGTVFICTTEGSVNFFAIAFKENVETPSTGIDSVEAAKFGGSSKFLRNGRIFIRRGDKIYTLQGQEVK